MCLHNANIRFNPVSNSAFILKGIDFLNHSITFIESTSTPGHSILGDNRVTAGIIRPFLADFQRKDNFCNRKALGTCMKALWKGKLEGSPWRR